jgi:transcriptional regulator of arginine metabolism
MANKRERQAVILELLGRREVGSQEDLRKLLLQRGWDVTQATLSRDLRELRVARVPTPAGARYSIADADSADTRVTLDTLLPQLFAAVDGVAELALIRTVRGGAQPIAEAIDKEKWSEVIGTIAGDDTILVVCRSGAGRDRVVRRVRSLAE